MTLSRYAALALVVIACTYEVRPPQPPSDPRERHRAEIAACQQDGFPPWLDDAALGSVIRADQAQAQASVANDSFHGAKFSSQPPAPSGSPHAAALLDERRAFQQWCAGLRAAAGTFVKP